MNKHLKSGFTLIELAIVLVIISVLISMIMFNIQARLDASKLFVTKERMQVVMDAINRYAELYGKLPCPRAARNLRSSANYGMADQARCDAEPLDSVLKGDIPFKTLGLDAQNVADGWGIRFDYLVASAYTKSDGLVSNIEQNYIVVRNAGGGSGDASIAYILLSHGPNTFGGYIDKNAREISRNSDGSNSIDRENADNDEYFVQGTVARDNDDILLYETSWHMPLYINGTGVGAIGTGGGEEEDDD